MNAAYDLPACIEFARAVAPYNIFWLEEPLHWYLQPADFALLAKATPIPLAHGERELTRFTTRDFMSNGFAVESHGSPDLDPIWHGLFSERAQVRDSYVVMNDKPGFGIDWAFAKKHGV